MVREKAPLCRIFFLFVILLLPACAANTQVAKREPPPQEAEQKKARFAALVKDLSSQTLPSGTTSQTVRNVYGEPDDIFKTGNAVSSFEIWIYKPLLKEGMYEVANPGRLYFDNGRLVSWTY